MKRIIARKSGKLIKPYRAYGRKFQIVKDEFDIICDEANMVRELNYWTQKSIMDLAENQKDLYDYMGGLADTVNYLISVQNQEAFINNEQNAKGKGEAV